MIKLAVSRFAYFLLLPFAAAFTIPSVELTASLDFGRAAVDITPPLGMPFQVPQRPPFPVIAAEGIHDPLHAKAIVFFDGETKAAVVACDLTSIPVHMIKEARGHVGRITGVPPENVMITATHTHTGPNIRPRYFRNATPEQMKIAGVYLKRLPELIAESVRKAELNLTAARLQGAMGEVHGVAFNRRFLMNDGSVIANTPTARLAEISRPAGPTDPTFPLLYLETPDGQPLASLINFSIHLDTTGGLQYSADFPYTISKILANVKGTEMLTHFTIGAAGNINHYNLLDPNGPWRTKGYGEAARIGTLLAAEVVRNYRHLEPLATTSVNVTREVVQLTVLKGTAERLARSHAGQSSFHDGELMVTLINGDYTFEAEVMVITIGDEVAFVGMPGEMFVELGLMLKQGSPYKYTFMNALANGTIGYVPDPKALREGGYGAAPGSTRCSADSGIALVDSAIRQLIAHRDMLSIEQ